MLSLSKYDRDWSSEMENKTDIIGIVKGRFADKIIDQHDFRGDLTLTVQKDCILELFEFCGTSLPCHSIF